MASIRCGCCRGTHATVAEVKDCHEYAAWANSEDAAAEQAAEIAAEQAYERQLEDAGWREAALQEEMEARMGVIPFDVALANAEARTT